MSLDDLRLRATVLSYFEVPWLGPMAVEDPAIGDLLLGDCDRVKDPEGRPRWTVADSVRRSVAADAGYDTLRHAWRQRETTLHDPAQWAIDQLIGYGHLPPLEDLSPERVTALEWATRWLEAGDDALPRRQDLDRQLRFGELVESLSTVATDHFVGRREIRARLAEDGGSRPLPVLITGFGGVGKSAVVARHMLDTIAAGEAAVAYLSFDRSPIDPAEPASLIRAMAQQLSWQLRGPEAEECADIARRARDRLRTRGRELEVQTRGLQIRGEEGYDLLARMNELLAGRPWLVVLDTLEQVQRRDLAVVRGFAAFVSALREIVRRTQIVLAGRAPMLELGDVEMVTLSGLERAEALALLRDRLLPERSERDLERVIDLVGTSPLRLRLAAGLLRAAPAEYALADLEVQRGAIEGELYRRLLGHIRDPDVRRLAHPGLTLRRVTPDLIRQVLARPCGVSVPDDRRAVELFEGLAGEAMLVERMPGNAYEVVHRADVRALMLEPLARDEPRAVERIHRAAIRFYKDRPDVEGRTEAMYHRLMLGQKERTLRRYWDPKMLVGLEMSVDEMPAASRAFLAARSRTLGVSDEDLREAELRTQRELLIRRVQRLAADNLLLDAIDAVEAHVASTRDSAPEVVELSVQLNELVGNLDEALLLSERERELAAMKGSTDNYFLFTLHVARIAERVGERARADEALTSAIDFARTLEPTERQRLALLQLLVARLSLARRSGRQGDVDPETLVEVVGLFDELGTRVVAGVPGLMRDLAAEVGAQAPSVLRAALRAVGITGSEGELAAALETLDDAVSGRVAEAAGYTTDAGPADWGAWVGTQERAELGDNFAGVFEAFGDDVDEDFTSSIADAFADEADAAIEFEPGPSAVEEPEP